MGRRKIGKVTFAVLLVNFLVWMVNIFDGGGSISGLFLSGGGYVKEYGELTYAAVFQRYEWWRLLTCGYIHLGVFHLYFNSFALLVIGTRMEKKLGSLTYFLIFHIGTIVTALLWCLIFREDSMVGASLGIFVLFGIYIVFRLNGKRYPNDWIPKNQWGGFLAYALIGNFLGITTFVVHVIGFCVGVLFGLLSKSRKELIL